MKRTFMLLAVIPVLLLASSCGKVSRPDVPSFQGEILTPWGLLSETGVQGSDLPCIEKPDGMERMSFSKDSSPDGSYSINLIYGIRGNSFDAVKNYFITKADSCNYKLLSSNEGSFSAPGFKITSSHTASFSKGDDTLTISVLSFEADGREWTFASLNYYHAPEEQPEEENSGELTDQAYGSENENPYDSEEEVDLADECLKYLDSTFRGTLESLFGGAKPVDSHSLSMQGASICTLKYVLKRKINEKDAKQLSDLVSSVLAESGYELYGTEVSTTRFDITWIGKAESVSIGGDVGEHYLEITRTGGVQQ